MNSTTTDQPTAAPSPPAQAAPLAVARPREFAPASEAVLDERGVVLNAFASERNFEAAQRIASVLQTASLVPKQYHGKENIGNCIIAMELANRIGASVFMVMQNLDIIHGRPGWRSTFLIATVNAKGKFTPLRFKFVGKRGQDDWGCYCVANDRETGEPCEGATIDITMAKAEGWYGRTSRDGGAASKWPTMPQQMLMYRAAAFWVRIYAPEVALGLRTADELQDMGPQPDGPPPALQAAVSLEEKIRAAAPPPPVITVPVEPSVDTTKQTPAAKTAEPKASAESNPAAPPPAAGANAGDATAGGVSAEPATTTEPSATCGVCKNPVGKDAVAFRAGDGSIGLRHPGCPEPKPKPEREPGED